MRDVERTARISLVALAVVLFGSTSAMAQNSAGSNNYIMENVSTGETLSKADGVISGSNGFVTTGVTGQNPNPQASGSNSYTMNPDNAGGGSTAPVGVGSGDGGGGGGCFAGVVGPASVGPLGLVAGLLGAGLFVRGKRRRA